MKTRLSACCVAMCAVFATCGSELDLSRTCIVRARKENAQQKAAADDLSKHIALITGAAPAEGAAAAGNATAVFLFAPPAGEPRAKFRSFARREGNTIRLWGDDSVTMGHPQYGSGFAAAEFLERFLGVLWVGPGDGRIVYARKTSCDVPDDWTWSREYPYRVSVMRTLDQEWGMRMKYAFRRSFPYRHAFGKWQEMYLKDHPEYFGLNPYGRRGVEGAKARTAKLCLSNDGCIDQIIANWTGSGTNMFLNICPNDGTPGYCFCEKCLALDERRPGESFYANLTDRYLNFWNRVTGRAREVRPDVKVVTYIYSYYRHAPRREKIRYPENMLFGVVPSGLDDYVADLEGWKAAGLMDGTFFLRPNFTAYNGKLPRGYERELYDSFHYYMNNGAFGFDYDGHWAPQMAFEYYVLMRQQARPELSFDRIEGEYCSQYGSCAEVAKAYFARVRRRGEAARAALREKMRTAGNDVLDDSMLGRFAVEGHSDEDLRGDLALLESADESALDPESRRRWGELKSEARGYIEALGAAEDRLRRPPALKEEGWRASFDDPGLQGWSMRDLEGRITQETASFDRYSVKFATRAEKSIALWRRDVPVTPGARYRLSFDTKVDGPVKGGFRVVSGGNALAAEYVRLSPGVWQQSRMEFLAPEGVKSVTLYFVICEGQPGRTVYLDNVVLARDAAQ